MTDRTLNRRSFLGTVSAAAALAPIAATAQSGPTAAEFAARLRELAGVEVLPRDLLTGIEGILDDMQRTALVDGSEAAGDLTKSVLKSLYTGMHRPQEGEPERFAYADALMFAAIEDTVNVPSYCGGVPGYWATKPEVS